MDYRTLAQQLGAQRVPGPEWPCTCLSPEHDDPHPSASINVEKGLWVCYSCGRGGRLDELYKGHISDEPPDSWLDEILADLEDQVNTRPPEATARLYEHPHHPYWAKRGFSAYECQFWGLGYDVIEATPVYPMRDLRGGLVGWVRRNLTDEGPKYRYPRRISKSHYLFGYHVADDPDLGNTLVLVEGALDAIKAWRHYPALGLYGSKLHAPQIKAIRKLNYRTIICAFDMDSAGAQATEAVQAEFTDHEVLVASWDASYKDVDEMPDEVRQAVLDGAT